MSDWKDPFADDEVSREREARRVERERRRREEAARQSLGQHVQSEMDQDEAERASAASAATSPPDRVDQPTEVGAAAGEPPTEAVPTNEEPPTAAAPTSAEPPTAVAPTVPDAPENDWPTAHPAYDEPATGEAPAVFPSTDGGSEFAGQPPLPPELPPTGARAQAPPPRRPSSAAVHRRRIFALVGIGVLILVVAVLGTIISRGGDSAPVTTGVPAAKKTIEVVVPEGYDRTQVADVAKKAGLKGDYLEATQSFKGFDLGRYGADGAPSLEGFLFPATYEVFKGAKVEDLVAKQLEAFEANAAEIGLEGAAKDLGYTPYEVVNVAAMVEKEIAVPEERKLAAGVIYNRLEAGTPLGIDATIRFEDSDYDGQIVQSRLEEDTPYNTRINAGLPPGPISNPGLASLEAAARPAETDFFYFVVKPGSCNEHTFVETEEEFAAAEQAYQDALIAEGGSPTDC